MRVFVTGATGWIGTAVVRELRAAGHSVLGMAHSDSGVSRLATQGVEVFHGDIRQPATLVEPVRSTDATIHLAFHMDFSDFAGINRIDREAIIAMLGAMEGTGKTFIGTNGTLVSAAGGGPLSVRLEAEKLVMAASERGIRSSVVRLAPTVHGAGDKGFIAMLIDLARTKNAAAYIDDGHHRWPAVHRDDAARLYLRALDGAPAVHIATAEDGVSMREIAGVIAEQARLPLRSVPASEAAAHFGWMAMVVGLDNVASSSETQRMLGWTPRELSLLDDMRAHYF